MLTVLAPCILPLLPVVIGSSAAARNKLTPYVVVGSLALSVIVFTYLLKASTALIDIPPLVWTYLSGGILTLFGLSLVFPGLWENIPGLAKLSSLSNKAVGTGYQKKSLWGDALIGAALGPVFSTCSPTYFVILASVLPASFLLGSAYLLAYVVGLSLSLLVLALLGEQLVSRLGGFADPKGWFKRGIGVLFIVLGLAIATGYEKKLETAILDGGFFDVTKIEQLLLEGANDSSSELVPEALPEASSTEASAPSTLAVIEKSVKYPKAPELVAPDGYLNTGPITIGEFKGKKVVLIDFWTYSCINCQRTTPFLNSWYDKYEDDGLVIIGVHTPEFAFEQLPENVKAAIAKEGIRYPIVLDNQYQTWNAFKNQYWPRKYLIDIDGYIVYDHAGEGDYAGAEKAIQKALAERMMRLGMEGVIDSSTVAVPEVKVETKSRETYFGWARNEFLANGTKYTKGEQEFSKPSSMTPNRLYLAGTWNFDKEYAENTTADARIFYTYTAKRVFFVASAEEGTTITVLRDGVPVSLERGEDVDANGKVLIQESGLYDLIEEESAGTHTIEIQVEGTGLKAFTFTFG